MHEAGILEDCTRRLQEDNDEALFKFIRRRIRKDVDYAKDIIAIADERLHLDRGTYKHSAKNLVRTEYGLDENNLQAFLGLTDQLGYIFPVKPNNAIDYDNPFMRPIFPQVLYENFFKGPQSFALCYAASFPVAHGRKEIPIGMLCLVTTAIYMALHDIAYENDRLSIQRKAASWDAEYADVMRFLVALKNRSPYGFSTMMAKLYEQASHGQQLQSRVNRVRDALAKINFDKLGTGSL
ncbi:hypothetical protein K474DRAFT_1665395 [Panus rudis PR-1116 ss-1]|nr:hypothetical protein K474DRAFT_1665395 [Panus rudis PR-1116 ss-1]